MYQASVQPPPIALPHDSRPPDARRDLAAVAGLAFAVVVSAVLWAVPVAVWWALR